MGDTNILKEDKEYMYILCYDTGEAYKIPAPEIDESGDYVDVETHLKKYGLNMDECSWMFSENANIQFKELDKE